MDREKVLNLAKLARIAISDTEAESLSHEFKSILGYVGEIKDAGNKIKDVGFKNDLGVKAYLRGDGGSHESGMHTEKILEQAPAREGNYIKVKKIL